MSAVSIISLIFSGVMLVVSIVNFFIANIRQAKQNSADAEHELASLREGILKANMKLDTVCATTNETRTDIKSLNSQLTDVDKRVTVVERDLKTAFIRIDELRERQGKTEE